HAIPVEDQGLVVVVPDRPDIVGRDGRDPVQIIIDTAGAGARDDTPDRAVPMEYQRLEVGGADRPDVVGRHNRHVGELVVIWAVGARDNIPGAVTGRQWSRSRSWYDGRRRYRGARWCRCRRALGCGDSWTSGVPKDAEQSGTTEQQDQEHQCF